MKHADRYNEKAIINDDCTSDCENGPRLRPMFWTDVRSPQRHLFQNGLRDVLAAGWVCLLWSVFGATNVAAAGNYRVELQPGLNLVGNHLNGKTNSVGFFLKTLPEGTDVYKIIEGGRFTTNSFESGAWTRPDETFDVGEGVYILNRTNQIVTFFISGDVLEGMLTNSFPAGLSIRTGMIPKRGKVTTDLGLKLSPFDNLYLWKDGRLETYTFLPGDRWHPTEPALDLGAAFVLNLAKPLEWIIEFQLNP